MGAVLPPAWLESGGRVVRERRVRGRRRELRVLLLPRLHERARALPVVRERSEEPGDLALHHGAPGAILHDDLLREEPAELHRRDVAPGEAVRAIEAIEHEALAVIERDEPVRRRDEQVAVLEHRNAEAPERLVIDGA